MKNGTARVPRLIVTEGAVLGLDRCRRFLETKNREASRKASETIDKNLRLIATNPEIGRPRSAGMREFAIGFGKSGYVALYRHDEIGDAVYILAFRHQKEAGF